MKAEHSRKFRKFRVFRLSAAEMAFSEFLSQGPTHKKQNKSLVHQKYADFVGFS
jgi:hypothetical protein